MSSKRIYSARRAIRAAVIALACLAAAGCGMAPSGAEGESSSASFFENLHLTPDAGSDSGEPAAAVSDPGEPAPEVSRQGEEESRSTAGETKAAGVNAAGEPEPEAGRGDVSGETEMTGKLASMTMEDKLAQMLILTPDALVGTDGVTRAGDMTQQAFRELPVGGIIFMSPNLQDAEQTKKMISNLQQYSRERTGLPLFTFVDEEGGTVRRISGSFSGVPEIGSMRSLGEDGSEEEAEETGRTIGAYLHALGFSCDFAPVADVLSNPQNQVVRERSFGPDPERVTALSCALAEGLREEGVLPVFKHFPGHGSTAADTHEGYAYTEKTLEELMECDLVPFRRAIENGAEFIMTAHITLPNVTESDLPASLSHEIITELLRDDLHYEGIVVTDAMNMGAVSEHYSSGEAAVMAVNAGADMILMPANAEQAYQGLREAVQSGRITEERIDESVLRILQVKGRIVS